MKYAVFILETNIDTVTVLYFVPEVNVKPLKCKIFEIKNRIVERDEYNNDEKLKMTSNDSECISQRTETKKNFKPN